MAHRWRTKQPTAADAARRVKYASRAHRDAAANYKQRQDHGEHLTCWRCQRPIPPTERAHVGHDDNEVNLIRGPEHRDCNLRAAARKGNAVQRARKVPVQTVKRAQSRPW